MEILNWLLEISVYSAVLFLAVMAAKKICADKMSPALHFAIWFILIARLCIPVTIDSGLKLIVIPQRATSETMRMETPALGQDDSYSAFPIAQDSADIPSASLAGQAPISNYAAPDTANNKASSLLQQTAPMKWTDMLIAAWLAGVLLRAVWMAAAAVKLKRILSKQGRKPAAHIARLLEQCGRELGIKRDIPVYLLPDITTPALTIALRPKLILPVSMAETTSDERLIFAIKHELMHYKRKDNIVGLLLRALEAAYWFNPVVWLLGRQMTADMETACDSMVVRTLDKQGRKRYVLTLLDMFSQKKTPRFVLGMALGNTEQIAEKRIRGVYMKTRSRRSVRFAAGMLAVVLFAACFTTACQPTPEKAAVVGKADGLPSQALNAEVKESPLPDVPETWSDSVKLGDSCTLDIDAEIQLPDTNVFPVYRLERNELTQEKLNELLDYLIPNAKYYSPGVFTKEYYEQRLIEAKRGQFVDGRYVPPAPDDPWVKSIEEKLANAPVANEVTPAGTDFDYYSDSDGKVDKSRGKNFLYVNFTAADGKSGSIYAQRYESGNSIDNRFGLNTNINFMEQSMLESQQIADEERQYYDDEMLNAYDKTSQLLESGFFDSFTLAQEDAIAQADKVIADLGIDSMGIARVEKGLIERYSGMAGFSDAVAQDQGYVIEYTRKLDGIDGYISHSSYSRSGDGSDDAYAPPFAMESILMVISENGVEYFGWDEMAQKAETVSGNSKLLPFDDIKERIVNQVKFNYAPDAGADETMEIRIDGVRLASAYINVKDDVNSVWDIPVWVAQGSIVYKRSNGKGEESDLSGIVLNALDGGVVLGQDMSVFTAK